MKNLPSKRRSHRSSKPLSERPMFATLPATSRVRPQFLHVILASLALPVLAGPRIGHITYISYSDAKPVLEALAEAAPAALRDVAPEKVDGTWRDWMRSRDVQIRERLTRGDEDSLVNFLLFGTTFTRAPRLTSTQVRELAINSNPAAGEEGALRYRQLVVRRIQDLVTGMTVPGNNERLFFARRMAE